MWINKGKKVPLMGFQTGGYIPGLSGAQFRGQLGSDIRQTQEDIEEQSRDIAKHEKKRGWMQKAGSWLGEKGLQYAMMSNPATAALMATPLGSAATKGIGSGLGRFIGGKAAGKGQAIEESSTGLLGGQYDTLKDIQKSNEEAQFGEAVKAGGTRFLTAGGADAAENYAKAKVPGLSKVFGEEGAALPESPELEMTGTMDKVFEMPDEVTRLELPASNPLVEDVAVGGGGDPMTTPQLIEDYMAEGGYVKGYENGGNVPGHGIGPVKWLNDYLAKKGMENVREESPSLKAALGKYDDPSYTGAGETVNIQSKLEDRQTALGDEVDQESLSRILATYAGTGDKFMHEDRSQNDKMSQGSWYEDPETGKAYSLGSRKSGKWYNPLQNLFSHPKEIDEMHKFQHGGNVPLFNPMSSHGAIDQLMDRNDMQSNYNDAIRRAEVMRAKEDQEEITQGQVKWLTSGN